MKIFVASCALACGIGALPVARAQVPELDLLIERLGDYLAKYEGELSTVVADERYDQSSRRSASAGAGAGVLRRNRRLDSEVTFLRLPGGAEWFGVRDVRKVDGKSVALAGPSFVDLIKSPTTDLFARAKVIVDASTRHNLDPGRTINMPTVPLEALSAQNHPRYVFRLRGKDRINGVETQRLDFEEFDEPTIVHSTQGESMWSRGAAWIEPDSGRLWRAELIVGPDAPGTFRRVHLETRVRVDFVADATLNVLVPKEMSEEFWIPRGRGTGRARYSNFRRFTTSARIVQ